VKNETKSSVMEAKAYMLAGPETLLKLVSNRPFLISNVKVVARLGSEDI
jgi:hypothetical protein